MCSVYQALLRAKADEQLQSEVAALSLFVVLVSIII